MRLWSLHPRYLDRQGLTALWREGLLAQAVIGGKTRGYRRHPQLQRFLSHQDPAAAIAAYLAAVLAEAAARGYSYDVSKVADPGQVPLIVVPAGQMEYEWQHLMAKLLARSPVIHQRWVVHGEPATHPLFSVEPGPVAEWERLTSAGRAKG